MKLVYQLISESHIKTDKQRLNSSTVSYMTFFFERKEIN